ncbi:MAG: hypothetical protein LBT50_06585 [Prevotellaceae bacterium]|jgi:hypothetical protein|nr:hypothetical protein [Prevotellaceae bacterium]
MKNLLEKDFINYYNRHPESPVSKSEINVILCSTEDREFELKDTKGEGCAKYVNPNKLRINIINYEEFIKPLPPRIKNTNDIGKDICDFIVYSENSQFFLLNELTNTAPEFIYEYQNLKGKQEGKLAKAQRQLKHSLESIIKVPKIYDYIRQFTTKQCCFFNSYSFVLLDINAEQAFNQLDEIDSSKPSKLPNPEIEAFGFDFLIYSASQTYLLSSSVKTIAE